MDMNQKIEALRESPWIKEKQFGDISSFNFTRKAFYDSHWDELTTTARGLFIDMKKGKIVARGYDKFFNLGENEENTYEALQKKLKFPVTLYRKENGFLGLLSYDPRADEFLFFSKSCMGGEYADLFKRIFFKSTTSECRKYLKEFFIKNDITLAFEVIDPVNDPHIITYDSEKVVLLDAIRNTWETELLPYSEIEQIHRKFGMEIKHRGCTSKDWDALGDILQWVEDCSVSQIEGYVFVDSAGYMLKVKTPYYRKWKRYRSEIVRMMKKLPDTPPKNDFLRYVRNQIEWVENFTGEKQTWGDGLWNIPALRKAWEKADKMERFVWFNSKDYQIWLDDERHPPEEGVWYWCHSVDEAKEVIEKLEAIIGYGRDCIHLSLDHDLGSYAKDGGDGIKLLDWLVERGTFYPVEIHSMNPVGAERMRKTVERYWK